MSKKAKNAAKYRAKKSKSKKLKQTTEVISGALKKSGIAASNKAKAAKQVVSEVATVENVKKVGETASKAPKAAKEMIAETFTTENIKKIGEIASRATDKENIKKAGKAVSDFATIENIKKTGKTIKTVASLESAKGAAKYAFGVKGYKELKEAREIKKWAEDKISIASEATENKKMLLNQVLESYADVKITTIKSTICVFVEYLKKINQKNKGREYEILESVDIKREEIAEIEDLGVSSANLAKGAMGSLAIGTIALFGTKAAVIGGVTAFGSASTGTAISSLSGAAATKAILAFLGGGSIASGGGGIAAGTIVLGGITAGAFAGVGALTGGILLSAHGSKALTRAKKYSAEVDKAVATLEKAWVAMDGIIERVNELMDLTLMLQTRALDKMEELKPLVPNFDTNNLHHKKVFQETALLMKSIGEIANTPILDENGSITVDSVEVAGKIRSILSTQA
jgi:hypothetical protein